MSKKTRFTILFVTIGIFSVIIIIKLFYNIDFSKISLIKTNEEMLEENTEEYLGNNSNVNQEELNNANSNDKILFLSKNSPTMYQLLLKQCNEKNENTTIIGTNEPNQTNQNNKEENSEANQNNDVEQNKTHQNSNLNQNDTINSNNNIEINNNINQNLQNNQNNIQNEQYNQQQSQKLEYINTISEKIMVKEEYIHGIKKTTYNNITYDLYSNGHKEIKNQIESIETNKLNYKATTQELKKEANENIEKYSTKMQEVANITNQYRIEAGITALTLDKTLSEAATVRALEMAYTESLTHTRPNGEKCFTVFKDLNIHYIYAGENVGDGFKYSENVCKAWKKSQSHYNNIVNSKFTKIGVGVAQSINGKYYWVQVFSD